MNIDGVANVFLIIFYYFINLQGIRMMHLEKDEEWKSVRVPLAGRHSINKAFLQ